MKLFLAKFNERSYWILSFLIMLSFLTFTSIFDLPDIFLIDTEIHSFSKGWIWNDGKSNFTIDLPHQINVKKNETLKIKNTVPENLETGKTIAFKSYMQSVIVKIDNKTVYKVNYDKSKFLGKDFDNFWVFIDTKSEHKGKEIEISLFSNRDSLHGHAPKVIIGNRAGLITYIFNLKGIWNILSFLILVVGLVTILIYFFAGSFKRGDKGVLYLGTCVSIIGCWLLGESGLLQFITPNTYFVTRITPIMQLLFPISINLYIKETIPMKKRLSTDIIATLAIINMVVSLLLEYFRIYSLFDSMILTLSLITLTCLHYIAVFLIETIVYKNRRAQKEFLALTIFFVSALVEIVIYYVRGQKETTNFILIGVTVYIILMLSNQIQDYRDRAKISNEKEFYESIAYTDALTKAENRASYIKDLENITNPKGITIVQADTDRLKYINDNFGHACGDQAIINTYKVLSKYLNQIGKVYRVGGDEFTVIIKNVNKDKISKILENIRENTRLINTECEYDFSISIGFAEYDASMDKNIHSTIVRADHNMYYHKRKTRDTVPQKYPANTLV